MENPIVRPRFRWTKGLSGKILAGDQKLAALGYGKALLVPVIDVADAAQKSVRLRRGLDRRIADLE